MTIYTAFRRVVAHPPVRRGGFPASSRRQPLVVVFVVVVVDVAIFVVTYPLQPLVVWDPFSGGNSGKPGLTVSSAGSLYIILLLPRIPTEYKQPAVTPRKPALCP